MRQVQWNRLAREDYYRNIEYLLNRWTEREAQNFIDEVDEIIFILSQGKIEYQETNYPNH